MHTLVDFDRLQSFTDGDPALEAELLGLFVLTAERYLAGLEGALGEPGQWRAFAHSLKGAAGNIGAPAVAELAAAAERTPPDPTRLGALQAAFTATRIELDAHLERGAVNAVVGATRDVRAILSGYGESALVQLAQEWPCRHSHLRGNTLPARSGTPERAGVGSRQHPGRIATHTENSLDPADHFDCYCRSFVGIVQAEPGHVPATWARLQ